MRFHNSLRNEGPETFLFFFLMLYLFLFYVCVCVSALDPLELKLQRIVGCCVVAEN